MIWQPVWGGHLQPLHSLRHVAGAHTHTPHTRARARAHIEKGGRGGGGGGGRERDRAVLDDHIIGAIDLCTHIRTRTRKRRFGASTGRTTR